MQIRSHTKSSIAPALPGLAGAVLFSAMLVPSYASADVSANIGAVSNYVWRGVSQTGDDAAIQGGVDYAHDSGFYAGTWTSNVDFGAGDQTSAELDLYLGYGGEVDSLAYDVGYIYYAFPDDGGDADFGEIYGELGLGPLALGLAVTTNGEADEGRFTSGDLYYYGAVELPLENDFSVGLTLGYYDFADDGDTGFEDISYGHVAASLAKDVGDFGGFSFNVELAESEAGAANSDQASVWVGWSKEF